MKLILPKKEIVSVVIFVVVLFVLALLHEPLNTYLRYERIHLVQHEYWRILTAHIVHANLNHGLLNIAGLVISMLIVGNLFKVWQWAISLMFMAVFISGFLFFFSPEVGWYVGFSGVLHGILMQGFLTHIFRKDYVFVLALLILLGKVIREQMPSFDVMHLRGIIEASVVVDAHMYGIFAGTFLAFAFLLLGKIKTRRVVNK